MIEAPQILDESAFEPPPEAVDFYAESLRLLVESDIPFLLSGTYALSCFTGIVRATKDLDVFCKPSDAPKILSFFKRRGHHIEVEDERWIGKVWRGDHFFDVIFNISSASIPITDEWFVETCEAEVYGTRVRITPPTQFILSKLFLQTRYRYDGADVVHTILRKHRSIDWKWLLSAVELYWEVLLIALLNFRFIYPTERDLIPRSLFDELIDRVKAQADMPPAGVRICRGRLLSPTDFVVDVSGWGFADVVGKGMTRSMSDPATDSITIAAIGDLHVTDGSEHRYRALFEEMAEAADVVVLCGDLTNFGKVREAEILAEDLKHCTVPMVGVLGNHDYECGAEEEVSRILAQAGVTLLDEQATMIEGVGFAGVKGFVGGFGRAELGAFGEKGIKIFVDELIGEARKLENQLRTLRTDRAVAVLHYAPIAETVEGEPPEIFPFLGSSRLAEAVDRFDNVKAVVHGHAHRGRHRGQTPGGAPVYNCAQFVVQAELGRPYALLEI